MHMYIGVLDSNRLGTRHRTDTGILVMAWWAELAAIRPWDK